MAMRWESSVWCVAAGSGCVFTVAVVAVGLPWWLVLAALAATVAAWSCAAPVATGALLGAIAWACVTGFDVNSFGDLHIHGPADLLRAAVLVAAGALAALAARTQRRPARRGARGAERHGVSW